jgi:hypothetical protein
MLHLLGSERKSVGCGWLPDISNVDFVTKEDYSMEPTKYSLCSKCFKHYSLPSGWTPDAAQISSPEAVSSCGSLSAASADSDEEVLKLQ